MSFLDRTRNDNSKRTDGLLEGVERAVTLADKFVPFPKQPKHVLFCKHFPRSTPEESACDLFQPLALVQPWFNASKPNKTKTGDLQHSETLFLLSIGTIDKGRIRPSSWNVYHHIGTEVEKRPPLVLLGRKDG